MSAVRRTEPKLIMLNELHQPIVPIEAVVKELVSLLGTLARNGTFCPLNVLSWKNLKMHKDMWNYIKRGYKSRIKKKYIYAYDNDEIRMKKRPKNVPKSVLKDILRYWNSDEAENMSKTNKENRIKLRYPHTIDKTSFAIIREGEMEMIETQESEDGSQSVDAYSKVLAPEHPGRVRLYGDGVTKTLLKCEATDSETV